MKRNYDDFLIRDWQAGDRLPVAAVINSVLSTYNLAWEPDGADYDALQVDECYLATGGEFWVIEHQNQIVGTSAYYPIHRGEKAVEIRKMYLLARVRGLGLGKHLLQQLELAISSRGFQEIWIETASVLAEAVNLYESNGYQLTTGIETLRCDRVYIKKLLSHKEREQGIESVLFSVPSEIEHLIN
jgi:putative acetyltransferase